MKLFEEINLMFSDTKKFRLRSAYDKGKNYFMINRFMSIKFPKQAMELSALNINGGWVVDAWAALIGSQYTRTPNWMYAKTKKGPKESTKGQYIPSEEVIKKYCEVHECSRRDFEAAHNLLGEQFEAELKEFELLFQ